MTEDSPPDINRRRWTFFYLKKKPSSFGRAISFTLVHVRWPFLVQRRTLSLVSISTTIQPKNNKKTDKKKFKQTGRIECHHHQKLTQKKNTKKKLIKKNTKKSHVLHMQDHIQCTRSAILFLHGKKWEKSNSCTINESDDMAEMNGCVCVSKTWWMTWAGSDINIDDRAPPSLSPLCVGLVDCLPPSPYNRTRCTLIIEFFCIHSILLDQIWFCCLIVSLAFLPPITLSIPMKKNPLRFPPPPAYSPFYSLINCVLW